MGATIGGKRLKVLLLFLLRAFSSGTAVVAVVVVAAGSGGGGVGVGGVAVDVLVTHFGNEVELLVAVDRLLERQHADLLAVALAALLEGLVHKRTHEELHGPTDHQRRRLSNLADVFVTLHELLHPGRREVGLHLSVALESAKLGLLRLLVLHRALSVHVYICV